MKKSNINEKFEQSKYEFDFDFPLSGFDYVLLAFHPACG